MILSNFNDYLQITYPCRDCDHNLPDYQQVTTHACSPKYAGIKTKVLIFKGLRDRKRISKLCSSLAHFHFNFAA